MATRAGLRTWLRRRLQSPSGDLRWTNAVLDDYLNFGYQFTQEEIEGTESDAFSHYIDKADLVANQQLYPLPVNAKAPRRLRMKTSTGGAYQDLEQRPWPETVPQATEAQQIEPARAKVVWSLQGRHIRIEPTPTASVTDGLELTYQPVLTMGSDTDVPEMTANYHANIVFYAQVLALSDTANVTDKKGAKEDMDLFMARLPRHWQRTIAMKGGTPPISVAPHVKYAPGGSLVNTANDFDSRA